MLRSLVGSDVYKRQVVMSVTKPQVARLSREMMQAEMLDLIALVGSDGVVVSIPRPCARHSDFLHSMLEIEEEEEAVSYTHLTLPTKRIVSISVVTVFFTQRRMLVRLKRTHRR
eukprot:TRINITY_DN39207_c0_g1_i1.p1 TRINITY_DN39207_c0_g1~~TRINITY_DN39207_c0_g1_i1.p1  ORF type:complete len:114 (+),score=23.35 TRINITY_DN39207_c0_g1_i1:84-425(+)